MVLCREFNRKQNPGTRQAKQPYISFYACMYVRVGIANGLHFSGTDFGGNVTTRNLILNLCYTFQRISSLHRFSHRKSCVINCTTHSGTKQFKIHCDSHVWYAQRIEVDSVT